MFHIETGVQVVTILKSELLVILYIKNGQIETNELKCDYVHINYG